MGKDKVEKDFSYYFKEIESNLEGLKSFPDDYVRDTAENNIKNIIELKKAIKGLNIFMIFLIVLTLSLALVSITLAINYYEITNDPTQAKKDELLNTNSKDKTLIYNVDGSGKTITYQDLDRKLDSIRIEYNKLSDSLDNTIFMLDYAKSEFGIKFKIKKQKDNTIYSISSDVVDQYRNNGENTRHALDEATEILRKKSNIKRQDTTTNK